MTIEKKEPFKKVDGGAVIVGLYDRLKSLGFEIKLPEGDRFSSEIGDDSDWHRTRKGYLYYDSFLVIGDKWLVSIGLKGSSYVSDAYDRDLFVYKIESPDVCKNNKVLVEFAERTVRRATYFSSSALVSMADGMLYVSPQPNFTCFGAAKTLVESSVLSKPKRNNDVVLLSSLSYPVTGKAEYYQGLSDELFEIFKQILV